MRSIFKDTAYFTAFIKELQSILDDNASKPKLDDLKFKRMMVRNSLYREQILIASYSMGVPLKELKILYTDVVKSICSSWTEEIVKFKIGKEQRILDQLYVHYHDSMLRMLSIGVLFEAKEPIESLKQCLDRLKIRNRLFDQFIATLISEHQITTASDSYCPVAFNKLEKIAFDVPVEEKKLIYYQKNWYSTLNKNYFSWKDTHLNSGSGFYGYWNFALAAVAKINSFKVEKLYNNPFFPTDLFLKSETLHKYLITPELQLLLSIDELIAKLGGARRATKEILELRKEVLRTKKIKSELVQSKVSAYTSWVKSKYLHEGSLEELNPYFESIKRKLDKIIN